MHPIDDAAARLFREQHGAAAGHQLLRHGTRRQIRYRADQGIWIPAGADVYLSPATADTPLRRAKAAELSRPHAIVSGRAAAHLHSLVAHPPSTPEISVRAASTHENPLAVARRRTDIRFQRIEGIRVTTAAQTIADLVGREPIREVERLIELAVLTGRTSIDALADRSAAMDRHHLPYRRVFRDILQDRQRTVELATSVLEAHLVNVLRTTSGLPPWQVQFPLEWWMAGRGRADAAIPAWRLIIEADGRSWHTRLGDFERDRERDQLAAAHGWLVLRFTWLQLVHDPARVAAVIVASGWHRAAA